MKCSLDVSGAVGPLCHGTPVVRTLRYGGASVSENTINGGSSAWSKACGPTALRNRETGTHTWLYPDDGSDDVLHTRAPHPPNLSRGADVGDGIAVDQHEVGPSSVFDHASVV